MCDEFVSATSAVPSLLAFFVLTDVVRPAVLAPLVSSTTCVCVCVCVFVCVSAWVGGCTRARVHAHDCVCLRRWMNGSQSSLLEAELKKLVEESLGSPMLFTLIEWLKEV